MRTVNVADTYYLSWSSFTDLFIMTSSICPGTWRGKVPVAIKQLRDDRVDSMPGGYEQARNEFFKEMKVFQMVNHPNCVQVSRNN